MRPQAEIGPIARTSGIELPVLDLAKLIDPEFSEEEAAKLHASCQEWGFFQVTFQFDLSIEICFPCLNTTKIQNYGSALDRNYYKNLCKFGKIVM